MLTEFSNFVVDAVTWPLVLYYLGSFGLRLLHSKVDSWGRGF